MTIIEPATSVTVRSAPAGRDAIGASDAVAAPVQASAGSHSTAPPHATSDPAGSSAADTAVAADTSDTSDTVDTVDTVDTADTADTSDTADAAESAQWPALARTFGLDIVGPIALHWWLTQQGWNEVPALMISGALPAIGIASDKLRGRPMGGLSILVLGGIALSAALGLWFDDARMVLLEGALSSLAAGLFAIATLFTRRTLVELFAVGSAGNGETAQGRVFARAFERADVRRLARSVTGVFAAVFFGSAAVQAALAWWAPVSVAFAYNRFGFIPCLGVIAAGSFVLFRRATERGELQGLMPQAAGKAAGSDTDRSSDGA